MMSFVSNLYYQLLIFEVFNYVFHELRMKYWYFREQLQFEIFISI